MKNTHDESATISRVISALDPLALIREAAEQERRQPHRPVCDLDQTLKALGEERQCTIEDLARERAAQIVQQQPSQPSLILEEWLFTWVEKYKTRTGTDYRSLIKSYINPGLGHYRLVELTKGIIEPWLNNLKAVHKTGVDGQPLDLAVGTKKRIRRCLHKALEDAGLERNPVDKVEVMSDGDDEDSVCPLSEAELELLMADTGNPYYDFFAVNAWTGLRRNEQIALMWRDFGFNEREGFYFLHVVRSYNELEHEFKSCKNKGKRTLKLWPATAQIIIKRLPGEPDGLIFPGKDGEPVHPSTITHVFNDTVRRLRLSDHHHFHDLRHTHATVLFANGWSLPDVAKRLGHRDPTVTLRTYAGYIPGHEARLISEKPDLAKAQSSSTVFEAKSYLSTLKVGHCGLEPQTSVLSGLRSNQLS